MENKANYQKTMAPKEPTLTHLISDLNSIAQTKNPRYQILILQLYAEHYVNEIVLEQVKEPAKAEVKEYLTFPQKLRILKKMDIVSKEMERILLKLNVIRNLLAHSLIISPEEISKKLGEANFGFKYSLKMKNAKDEIIQRELDLYKIYKDHPGQNLNKLTISCAIIISIIYNRRINFRGEKPKEVLNVSFRTAEHNELLADLRVYQIK